MTRVLRSTRYITVPFALTGRVLIDDIQASAHSEGRYNVRLLTADAGPVGVGYVEKRRTETWRKVGRIRTSLIGRPVHWEAFTHRHQRVGYRFGSMAQAALRLAELHTEVQP